MSKQEQQERFQKLHFVMLQRCQPSQPGRAGDGEWVCVFLWLEMWHQEGSKLGLIKKMLHL